jgi:transcriptional regulator with XRE-family HTH domain
MLAERIDRSRATVERMLAGESNPGLAVIDDIARKLDVAVAELVRGL